MSTTKTSVEELAAQVLALSPPARLRLAADLMEAGRGDVAHGIIYQVALELGYAISAGKTDRGRRS